MKNILLILTVALSVMPAGQRAGAAQTNAAGRSLPPAIASRVAPATNAASSDLRELYAKIQAKVKEGKKSEAELAEELKAFDALASKYKDDQTGAVPTILYGEALLYWQTLGNQAKGTALLDQLKRDFPASRQATNADRFIAAMKKRDEALKIQNGLKPGTKFPDFDEKDVTGKPLSVASYKGKVVLVDFWATWCGPCVRELPNVLHTYEKYHGKGFEIIGVSLDRDEAKLTAFTKDKNMPWQQFFDGGYWTNKLAVKYGVNSIPATYLLDGEGKIIDKNLRGEALETAVGKALGAN
jgi:peroxiredoxin